MNFSLLTPIFEESSVSEIWEPRPYYWCQKEPIKRNQCNHFFRSLVILYIYIYIYIFIYLYISDKHHDLTNPMPRHAPTTWPPSSSILLDWKLGSDRHVHDTKYGYKIMCLPCITITLLGPPPPLLMVACFGYKRAWSENEFYQN